MSLFGQGKPKHGRDAEYGMYSQKGAAIGQVFDGAGDGRLSLIENDTGSKVGHLSSGAIAQEPPIMMLEPSLHQVYIMSPKG